MRDLFFLTLRWLATALGSADGDPLEFCADDWRLHFRASDTRCDYAANDGNLFFRSKQS